MLRPIDGYHVDEAGDWVAELGCGHGQHVRHRPPFFQRPWVVTPGGRASMLGTSLECPYCDRLEMPSGLVAYKRTPDFDQRSIPAGLRKDHATKAGVWGLIHVTSGRLRYCIDSQGRELVLAPGTNGVIPPELVHHVEPDGEVSFFVEFHRKPEQARPME